MLYHLLNNMKKKKKKDILDANCQEEKKDFHFTYKFVWMLTLKFGC